MRLFDCFLFNDELDLLELRLMETQDVVDRWVLVECPTNWQQKPKPLFYQENIHRFWPWRDRIEHKIVYEHPMGPYPVIEYHQRRALAAGWERAEAKPGDIVVVGDADEIPKASALEALKADPPPTPVVLRQHLYYYAVNCLQNQLWNGSIAFVLEDGVEYDVQGIRDTRNMLPVVEPGGWHFSWLGPMDNLKYKLSCQTAAEETAGKMVAPDAADEMFLRRCLETGADLFGRTDEYAQKRFIPLQPGTYHPDRISEWLDRHPQYARGVTGA